MGGGAAGNGLRRLNGRRRVPPASTPLSSPAMELSAIGEQVFAVESIRKKRVRKVGRVVGERGPPGPAWPASLPPSSHGSGGRGGGGGGGGRSGVGRGRGVSPGRGGL